MRSSSAALCALSAIFCVQPALAAPTFDTFGPLPEATFGGTGIPNDEVAAGMQIVDGTVTITVALSATQRFSNPALTNDSAGTYFATPGSNFGGAGESSTEGALWNFNYYIEVDDTNGVKDITDYQFDLYYDFDPAFDNNIGTLGVGNITASVNAGFIVPDANGAVQGSQNLLFNFLTVSSPGFQTPPAGSFDPNVLGEYNFAITVADPNSGFPVETVAIDVQVVPEPGSLALLGLGGLLLARRRCG